jgi:hypothetical protein
VNERQRDLFLFLWSERRKPGQMAVALRGALIGALGGVAFALIMLGEIDTSRAGYTGLSAIIPLFERGGALLAAAIPAFAGIGFVLTNRIFAAQEAQYQAILRTGAQIPAQKPVMQPGDRGPAIAVAIAAAIIAGFIIVLFVMYW